MVAIHAYDAGDEVFGPANRSDRTYRIASGHVRLYRMLPDGRSINVALLGPGEFFSQVVVDDDDEGRCSAEVIDDARIEAYAPDARMNGFADDHAHGLIESQARQITALHMLVEHLLARDTGVRLATTLLDLAGGFGTERDDGRVTIALPITHQGLANMIGSNRVTVTRKMIEFSQANAVRSEGRNTLVIDPDRLRVLTAG